MTTTDTTLPAIPAPQALAPAAPLPPDRHPAKVYIARLAEGSRRTMRAALEAAADVLTGDRCDAETLPWHQLRYQHTQALRTALANRYAPATANKILAAVRGALKEAWRLGQMDAADYHRAVDLEPVRGSRLPRGRALSSGELRALFLACGRDRTPAGARDAALLAVLYGAGLRRSEAVGLDLSDYDPGTGALTVRGGKGNKDRIAYAQDGAARALSAWLSMRGQEAGPLFLPIAKGGRIEDRRLTDQAVRKMLLKRAGAAGVAAFSPHDLRRTMISDLLDAGADISAVQQLAGHASVITTARYDRRGEAGKRKAAAMLHVPYDGR